jgi:SAM-dependent methyltransferase
VQLGGPPPDNSKVFPPDYPYTTGSSKPLIENFRQLAQEVSETKPGKLSVCDIGSNDGTLLQCFRDLGHSVLGIEPTDIADIANANGIPTSKIFFNSKNAEIISTPTNDKFDVITCCNCFAHMPDVNGAVEGIKKILKPDGIFVSESHYLFDLLRDVQYDTIYHEHLRFYSVRSLYNLFNRHDLHILKVKNIPTHGGSIRVYVSAKDAFNFWEGAKVLQEPTRGFLGKALNEFAEKVIISRRQFWADWLGEMVGIGAPSRGTILINYLGLNHNDLKCVAEREGSLKIGRYIPGTRIPVVNEQWLFDCSALRSDYALILSWHMADTIMSSWRSKGFKGKFIIPLPEPRII